LAKLSRKNGNEIFGSWQLAVAAENWIESSGVDRWQAVLYNIRQRKDLSAGS
jgi:hypothetical protein